MEDALEMWIYDNAELFRYAGELSCMRESGKNILLSGDVSAFLASTFRKMYPDAVITAVDENEKRLEEARKEDPSLIVKNEKFDRYFDEKASYDIVVSALQVEKLDTRELVSYLYNLSDMIEKGGNLLISFPAAHTFSIAGKELIPSWYSMDEKIYMKRYLPEEIARAVNMIGFDLRALEKDENPDLETVVTIHAVKK